MIGFQQNKNNHCAKQSLSKTNNPVTFSTGIRSQHTVNSDIPEQQAPLAHTYVRTCIHCCHKHTWHSIFGTADLAQHSWHSTVGTAHLACLLSINFAYVARRQSCMNTWQGDPSLFVEDAETP